jgi:hypothetical protein
MVGPFASDESEAYSLFMSYTLTSENSILAARQYLLVKKKAMEARMIKTTMVDRFIL